MSFQKLCEMMNKFNHPTDDDLSIINDKIDAWHEGGGANMTLHEWLGMSHDEYKLFVEKSIIPCSKNKEFDFEKVSDSDTDAKQQFFFDDYMIDYIRTLKEANYPVNDPFDTESASETGTRAYFCNKNIQEAKMSEMVIVKKNSILELVNALEREGYCCNVDLVGKYMYDLVMAIEHDALAKREMSKFKR